MLVLSRKPGENVFIGNDITHKVVEVTGNRVRITFDAPNDVCILRGEPTSWQGEPVGRDEPAELEFVCEW